MSVAIVILNWNGKRFLEKFIPVLLERTGIPSPHPVISGHPVSEASLFVADNGSTDGSVEWLKRTYSPQEVKVLRFDRNYGFTGGYNRAFAEIEKMEGDPFGYYLLLNDDIEVTEGWLDVLVQFMDGHPECGACAPKILSYDRRDYFEHAGASGGFVDRFYFPYCRGRVLDHVEKDEGQYDEACQVFWASGAALMIRSELWHHHGGLDESFFAHMEEIDLCWRLQRAGWQIWAVPASRVYHVGGGTLPNNSPRKLYLNFRNNLLMMYKNLPLQSRNRIIFCRMLVDGAISLVYLFTGKFSFFTSVCKAHRDFRKMKGQVPVSSGSDLPRPKETLVQIKLRGGKFSR